ncbi:YHS domain-containing (seleno)protein [Undibacterium parvum]|uniref:YHS domain-containing protein n=1 Tax=Undibacterium parvum TaxID=401471 RepID=A0A3S9HMJ3_9BURK|nr:YHS domain-containing (seleno)protein [Undibacterium parvum]AZP13343.1 YHS domain-containing protein [Undibacterium parvum]
MKFSLAKRSTLIKAFSTVLLVIAGGSAFAVAPIFSTEEGAIRGYDPVAYFKQNKPVKGRKDLSTTWQGAQWHFSSQANLDAFKADPEKYAPQYGGYCAYGVAQGYTPEIDPSAYKVLNGKLYLNLSPVVLKKWKKDIPGYVKDADKNWPELKAGTYVEK